MDSSTEFTSLMRAIGSSNVGFFFRDAQVVTVRRAYCRVSRDNNQDWGSSEENSTEGPAMRESCKQLSKPGMMYSILV
jgi:hypothetical protein